MNWIKSFYNIIGVSMLDSIGTSNCLALFNILFPPFLCKFCFWCGNPACDGIFLNYWWNPGKEERPGPLLASRAKAAARREKSAVVARAARSPARTSSSLGSVSCGVKGRLSSCSAMD